MPATHSKVYAMNRIGRWYANCKADSNMFSQIPIAHTHRAVRGVVMGTTLLLLTPLAHAGPAAPEGDADPPAPGAPRRTGRRRRAAGRSRRAGAPPGAGAQAVAERRARCGGRADQP